MIAFCSKDCCAGDLLCWRDEFRHDGSQFHERFSTTLTHRNSRYRNATKEGTVKKPPSAEAGLQALIAA